MLLLLRTAFHITNWVTAGGILASTSMLSSVPHSSLHNQVVVLSRSAFRTVGYSGSSSRCSFISSHICTDLPSSGPACLKLSRPPSKQFCIKPRAVHVYSQPRQEQSNWLPVARSRQTASTPLQSTGMQSMQAVTADTGTTQKQTARQQNAVASEKVLPDADTATFPFLARSSAQPARARVDYSQSQRPLHVVDPEVEMVNPADWDVICDVRTPDEFEEDHLIGAINTPVLSNEQRAEVGTLYKQIGQHEAKRLGAALISRNISEILLSHFQQYGKNLKVLVYCWRGGERSQSLAHILSRVGWEVAIIKRGYMGYRNQVRRSMEVLGRFQYHVIGGATGSGKGKLLDCLRDQHGQNILRTVLKDDIDKSVLVPLDDILVYSNHEEEHHKHCKVVDLEVAADHRGSILGDHPTRLQPPQKMFESKLLHQMRNFSVDRPVFIESESSLVGRRQVPAAMWKAMQAAAQVTELEVPLQSRVAWLRRNYSYFEDEHKNLLMAKLDALTKTSGKQVVGKWRALAEQGKWDDFVASMLQEHYDVVYARAQVKYLTPGNSQQQAEPDSDLAEHSGPERTVEQYGNSCMQLQRANSNTGEMESTTGSSDEADHLQEGNNGVAKAASALSHLFGGPREKLMQQMSTKQAESTLRWHRQPVDDVSDDIYSALAVKILTQHDPAALRA